MTGLLNLHGVFSQDKGYLRNLQVPSGDETTLRVSREKIRATVRQAFGNWEAFVRRSELLEGQLLKSNAEFKLPRPKFRIQGSFAYHTVNDCQQPPQQIDQDDGIFLPVSFVFVGKTIRPVIASNAYFTIVENALQPLCDKERWKLNPEAPKSSCVRVEINSRLHIDLPLYAIKDDVFHQLVETAARATFRKAIDAALDEALSEDIYGQLAETEIVLAHREQGWIESDPRKLEKWFETAIRVYGPAVRNMSRIFKGFRDAQWDDSDLGSICIMAAVVNAISQIGPLDETRDDLTALDVARLLPDIFSNPIENPVFPGQKDKFLCNGWEDGFREDIQRRFKMAADHLDRAIYRIADKQRALDVVKIAFGARIPTDAELINRVSTVSIIRQTPPIPVPRPMVPRTRSG